MAFFIAGQRPSRRGRDHTQWEAWGAFFHACAACYARALESMEMWS
ncbi:hypothetical protein P368_18715 [Comamonas thiooxydans]|uniref:Uncharacterized protein n=1 Tax=Comamonas thiooxydans TaxID=363952 RepID=A0A096DUU6_9BURK|nr:hypothetical protein P609_17115 [Comamonas thiooxydans]KGG86575.1 hypothetical protein P369_19620 [Comamonas thiooxydans]KGG93555.1 hypothetical protein P245_09810 [Comamonas thiooxydans]KGG97671.1 hypothetical protein P365_23440 [Comamonas thiooxydans]KGG98204.1 hypothetical protein P367_14670 [Comamonas thiooxydans]